MNNNLLVGLAAMVTVILGGALIYFTGTDKGVGIAILLIGFFMGYTFGRAQVKQTSKK